MSLSVIPPPEFAHVNNPVFVSVAADNAAHTILVDIYHQDRVIYTASAQAGNGTRRFNIAEILQTIVQTPLPWPAPDNLVSSIANWLAEYRLEVREMEGATAVAVWTSRTLYAVPGGIDDELFLELSAAGTDIFQTRLLNPAANRFLTVYADVADSVITLPENPSLVIPRSSLLYFIAKPGESLQIEVASAVYDYSLTDTSLYCINPAAIQANGFTARFGPSAFPVTVNFSAPIKSWPVRTWLFLNHFGVFESYLTTGRAKSSVTRPDHPASRYVPDLDKFYDIDLGSKPVETVSLNSGFTNAAGMQLLRRFVMSDCIFLLSSQSFLSCYIIKQADRIFADDSLEPHSTDLQLTRSVRKPVVSEHKVYLPTPPPPVKVIFNLVNGQYNLVSGTDSLITGKFV
jgi:hypothetical protein